MGIQHDTKKRSHQLHVFLATQLNFVPHILKPENPFCHSCCPYQAHPIAAWMAWALELAGNNIELKRQFVSLKTLRRVTTHVTNWDRTAKMQHSTTNVSNVLWQGFL